MSCWCDWFGLANILFVMLRLPQLPRVADDVLVFSNFVFCFPQGFLGWYLVLN